MSFLKKIIKIFFAKKTILKLPKKKILIYDTDTTLLYKKIFDENKNNIFSLDIRYESLNLRIYLKSIISYLFQKENTLLQIYIIKCIEEVDPKFVITFTNYDIFFWRLKKYFNDKKFVMLQNNSVNGQAEASVFVAAKAMKLKKQKTDYILTWAEALGQYYHKFVDGKIYKVGSIKNNFVKNRSSNNKKDIAFISQYKNHPDDAHYSFPALDGKTMLSKYKTDLQHRTIVLKVLDEFCKKRKLNLIILSRSSKLGDLALEQKYYEKIIGKKNFKLIAKKYPTQNFERLNNYKYFVSISTSLGYEALSRGKRVAYLNICHSVHPMKLGINYRYGWPNKFPRKGPFWAYSYKKKERCKV